MEFVGRKLRIFLAEGAGTLDGFVNTLDRDAGKLTLEKVVNVESGKKMLGLQHLFAEDIEKIDVLEAVTRNTSSAKVKEPEPIRQRSQGILRSKYVPEHLQRLKVLDPTRLVLRNQQEHADGLNSSGESAGSDTEGYADYNGVTIISKVNKQFHEAIAYITKHQMVAVSVEGVSVGRNGKLCWILVATQDHVFMFDVLRMGKECFDNGLQDILQNGDILKVFHDCRLVADMLYHQYGIEMINVFDTQVANVFVFRLGHHNDWPRYVDGLAPCLVHHLDLAPEDVNWAVVRERCRQADEEVWAERPLKKNVVSAAVRNVIYLLELRAVLNEKMMEEFVAGVNIYLTHVKDASTTDAVKYQSNSHLLPQSFQYIRKFMAVYSGHNPNFAQSHYTTDKNGFRENCSGIAQPNVVFSRDSLWHATTAGGDKSGRSRGRRRYVDYFLSESKHPTSSMAAEPLSSSQPGQFDDISVAKTVNQSSEMGPAYETDPTSDVSTTPQNITAQNTTHHSRTDLSHTASHSDTELVDIASRLDQSAMQSDTSKLSGTSLMRALVLDQTPNGIASDSLVFKPAGVQASKNVSKAPCRNRPATLPGQDSRPPRAPSQFRGQHQSYSDNVHHSAAVNQTTENAARQDVDYGTKYTSFTKFGMISQQEIDFARLNYPLASKIDSPKSRCAYDNIDVDSQDRKHPQSVENFSRDQNRDSDDENWGDDPVDVDLCFADDRSSLKFKPAERKVSDSTDQGKLSVHTSEREAERTRSGVTTSVDVQSQGLIFQSRLTPHQRQGSVTKELSPKAKRLQDTMQAIQLQKEALLNP